MVPEQLLTVDDKRRLKALAKLCGSQEKAAAAALRCGLRVLEAEKPAPAPKAAEPSEPAGAVGSPVEEPPPLEPGEAEKKKAQKKKAQKKKAPRRRARA